MAFWKILSLLLAVSIIVDAKKLHPQKRDILSNICDPLPNNTNKVQCYCINDKKDPTLVANADCYLAHPNIAFEDRVWSAFKTLGHVPKITFLNTRGIPLTYIPSEALKETTALKKLNVKYGMINTIGSFAFANLSLLEDIILRDNQIVFLDPNSFIHHNNLKSINLDTNSISEINRNVFVDLPSLEKLYLTNNQISTIHDRAFISLINLKELEIDRNKIFSLNYAVFDGLKNLERLDLSGNTLEVIGDNTFQALENLKILNLEDNSIQMLDEKAFYGLGKMRSLSLAHNKLADIDNDMVFNGLESLISLSFKGNQLKQLKPTVMAPILHNFYGNTSNLDVEDNDFPCDCRLDWFISLMNKTSNKYLQISIENFKCSPDVSLREMWTKIDKNAPQVFEEDESQQGNEFEYYDDTQLNGKLFYVDVRELLKCNKNETDKTISTEYPPITKENASPKRDPTTSPATNLKTSPTTTITTEKSTKTHKTTQELPITDTTSERQSTTDDIPSSTHKITKSDKNRRDKNGVDGQDEFTTTRLATVSAKPIETKIYENMASDEAKPDNIKLHRSVQGENMSMRRTEEIYQSNNANKHLASVMLLFLTVLICFRLHI